MKTKALPLISLMLLIIFILTGSIKTQAQDYEINFSATGITSSIDSVKVENITQNTSLSLLGTDILHLVLNVSVKDLTTGDQSIQVYPNPMNEHAEIIFFAKQSGNTDLIIYDISGRKVLESKNYHATGLQRYKMTNLKQGLYFIHIIGENYFHNAKIISLNIAPKGTETLEYLGLEEIESIELNSNSKSIKAIIDMDYTTGDVLRYTGFSGLYTSIVTDIPTGNETIIFNFIGIPTVTTSTISLIAQTTASSGGNITDDGGAAITAHGVCWSISSNPVVTGNHTSDGTGTGSFTSNITGLTANTTYYVRAYATNSAGTAYGNEISFTTSQNITVPTLTTFATSNVSETTATSGGNITSDGGATVTARGVCWGSSVNPVVTGNHTNDGTGTGSFTSSITGLIANTTYHVRAYATNSAGTAYGSDYTFTTTEMSIENDDCANAITLIQNTSCVIVNGTTIGATQSIPAIACDGYTGTADDDVWYKFVATTSSPTIIVEGDAIDVVVELLSGSCNGTNIDCADATTTGGVETINATSLTVGATYYIRIYSYSSTVAGLFTICVYGGTSVTVPTLTTASTVNITQTTATSGGNITSDGGASVTARGVCWSTSVNPVVTGNHTSDGTGTGIFTSNITGLTANTTYYVRAYATNSAGTAYGNEISFTTLQNITIPTLTTASVVNISQTTATSGGNITNDGGASVTARGVCWSTSANPVVTGSHTSDGTGTGIFSSSITGLTANTTYYVRAYATNSAGTAYGNEISFTTSQNITVPILTTTAVSSIAQTTATSGGNITSDGGASVTSRGVCWSASTNPVATGNHTSDGTGTGAFTSSITGLTANTTYYVRAYATNSVGTAYGNEISFTTLQNITLPTITTAAVTPYSTTSVWTGGNITSDGGSAITDRGVCWSTSQNPLITDNHNTGGTGTGSFTSFISGLALATIYYIRAYATNSVGTAYGNEVVRIVVGANYQGGIVAYILESDDLGYVVGETHGLIVSLTNQGTAPWGCNGINIHPYGGDHTSIGTGMQNTIDIVSYCGGDIAARICSNYTSDGYEDWYLPSRDELYAIYLNRSILGSSFFECCYYWTSTESTIYNAYYLVLNVSGYEPSTGSREFEYLVRPVRSF